MHKDTALRLSKGIVGLTRTQVSKRNFSEEAIVCVKDQPRGCGVSLRLVEALPLIHLINSHYSAIDPNPIKLLHSQWDYIVDVSFSDQEELILFLVSSRALNE